MKAYTGKSINIRKYEKYLFGLGYIWNSGSKQLEINDKLNISRSKFINIFLQEDKTLTYNMNNGEKYENLELLIRNVKIKKLL